jgi:hypothetical protein
MPITTIHKSVLPTANIIGLKIPGYTNPRVMPITIIGRWFSTEDRYQIKADQHLILSRHSEQVIKTI